MPRIDEAQARLQQAVARLERARSLQMERISSLRNAQSGAPDAAEMNNLVRALDEAQRENAALVAEREAMADRVDAILDRLKSVAGLDEAGMDKPGMDKPGMDKPGLAGSALDGSGQDAGDSEAGQSGAENS